MSFFSRLSSASLCLCGSFFSSSQAAPPEPPFRVPAGLKVDLFAADPQLANPVAFCIDERGRVYVAEEYRFNRGTEENRTRPFLLEDDLQIRTVADRLAMFQKWSDRFEGGMAWFSKHADQVRRLEDRDGDGKADRSTVFAGGFNGPLDGLAAGVIARDGDVYLTCIPNLWRLRDTDGDGVADVRAPLIHGFGVNAGFLGHDLHGLAWGPDGKLYFSIGDRGFHVEVPGGKTWHGPRTGAVFRCNPDGTDFEVVARGLRNPQELAFDAYGNLFADDNNCDKGDDARLVYVVEGGDSGWNMAYQTIPEPYLTGPWHAERMWHLPREGQPAWIVPPVGKIGAGPSGFATYPGLGLPDRYRDHFFYCNYTGNGGVESFAVRPKGAGFEMVDHHDVLKPIMATDVDFGYDGRMYVAEFGRLEWDGSNRAGRIYTVSDPSRRDDPAIKEVERLFKEGFRQRPDEALAGLLRHPDMRVRQRAQYALAERGARAIPLFAKAAIARDHLPGRLHAIWGLGQVGRTRPEALRPVIALLGDAEPKVRGQSARVLGDTRHAEAAWPLIEALKDDDAQVRFHAATALGKLRHAPALDALFAMVREDAGRDPFLRHAAVMALLGIGDGDAVRERADDPSPAVRMAVLLVGRRLGDPGIARFLDDPDLALATEAARAINDVPIEGSTAALAKWIETPRPANGIDLDPLLRRSINANFRLGGAEDARRLATFAADASRPLRMREEALSALADWDNPPSRDRVNGFWRPVARHDPALVRTVLDESSGRLLAATSGPLHAKVIDLLAHYGGRADAALFLARVSDPKDDPAVRLAALRLLARRKDPRLDDALQAALATGDAGLRAEARHILAGLDPSRALASIAPILEDARVPLVERQRGLATLAGLKTPAADALLTAWVERLAAGSVPAGIQLDLIEAATARGTPALREALRRVESTRSKSDPLAPYRPSLEGGDAERGRVLFTGHVQAQCIRCHRVADKGGTAGPELTKVASRADREYLLQSIVDPDARIAPDYGTVALALQDGRVVTGVLKAETKDAVTLETPDGHRVRVVVQDIDERSQPRSAMPKMGTVLSPREIRDVVEYLSTLK